jgi:NOL1/NOP2/sun family putative RNA methylase
MPDTVPIPPLFLERMSKFLGKDFSAFAEVLTQAPIQGLRVNTLKLPADEFKRMSPGPIGENVPWCNSAFVLPNSDFSFGKHPYHLAGLYYLQDPSAMSAAILLDPKPGERILDLAAAPGGKTTHLASLMNGRGLLVANEIKNKRVNHLVVNVERWGAGNVVITNESPERLADHFGPYFDRVLVDAPCSGEGMFRKDMGARADWSPEMVAGCAVRQGNILRVAGKLVRPGGRLGYSTCTFAPEEDEEVIARFLEEFPDYEVVELPLLDGFLHGQPEWMDPARVDKSLNGAARLFPHHVTGEGHFVCVLRRKEGDQSDHLPDQRDLSPSKAQLDWWDTFAGETLNVDLPAARFQVYGDRLYLVPEGLPPLSGLRVVHPGVWLGNFKKDRFEPAHPLALFLKPGQAKKAMDLASNQTGRSPLQKYLAGETIPSDGPSGWTLVTVDSWPLGWGKRVQGIVKNHYPHGWQIYS